MPHMFCALLTLQVEMSLLKEFALLKAYEKSVTLETSQLERSWLKERAPEKMYPMFCALLTFQVEMSPLKEDAGLEKAYEKSVTLETSHLSRSSLKLESLNRSKSRKEVTPGVKHHSFMGYP